MTDNNKEYFDLRKKEVLQDVQNTARSFIEDKSCINHFANAAWAIASGRPGDADCLSSPKAGDQESLMVLQRVAANAVRIVTAFEHMRRAYNSGTLTQEKLSRLIELIDQADNSVEIASDCTKERGKNGKVYLKSILFAFIGGMFGGLVAFALKTLVCARPLW